MEIKKAAKAGRQSQVRILAKDLIRIRKSKDKLLQMARCGGCGYRVYVSHSAHRWVGGPGV